MPPAAIWGQSCPPASFWPGLPEGEQRAIVSTSGLVFFERPPAEHSLAGSYAYVMNT